jgi:hypothetical protein
MAKKVRMSRQRFYDLIGDVFPKPLRDENTQRPYYDDGLQKICIEVKNSKVGINGKPIIFYGHGPGELILCEVCGKELLEKDFYFKSGEIVQPCKSCYNTTGEYEKRKKLYNRNVKLKKYNLSLTEYNEFAASQYDRCAICGESTKNTLHIDHDHTTGNVRGLLCPNCNIGLGNFKDDVTRLWNAIAYLELHRKGLIHETN